MKTNDAQTQWLGDLFDSTFPESDYLIGEGLLERGSLLMLGGPPKAFKSFLINTFVYHLVLGGHLFGAYRAPHGRPEMCLPVRGGQRVLLFENEIGPRECRDRFLSLTHNMTPEQRSLFRQSVAIHSCDYGIRLDSPDGLQRIASVIEAVRPTVVAFDPLIEFHGQDENSTQGMARVLHNLDLLRTRYQFTTIISHHTGKPDPSKGRSGPDLLRGNSVIFGKGDSFLMVTHVSRREGQLTLDFTIRRGAPISQMRLALNWAEKRAMFLKWSHGKDSEGPIDVAQLVNMTQ